ncbi:Gfo/Idh/MocA family protein [Calycomorphotria hydatis]|uniref:Inositol 2-dehydrogenase n=1 Tax=Calycomorphotria hydatis TaxID=2528027 RepID=A0A517TB70_9PLAN|nr:Gfo/Idh/MocA family oxidoreductase [Calycomorphotria hydatis]QDT65618.1 Inositol 2-dehydrogenase [Calycomorphotria hydatis]
MAKIKIGQIGIGHSHAAGKMKALRQSNDFEVVGLSDPNPNLRNLANQNAAYEDVKWLAMPELLNDEQVAAIAVETDIPDLLNVAEACIDAGKHIHLDKPAGLSLPQFQRILDKAAQRHLTVQMGYMYRTHPGIKLLDECLQNGWIGEPFAVHAVLGKLMNKSSRQKLLNLPGGIMFELGGHMIDIVVHLLGKPDNVHAVNQHSSPIDDGYKDNMLAVLEYPRAHATVHCSCNDVDGFARRQLVVCGTEGTVEIRPMPTPSAKIALTQNRGRFQKGWQEVSLPKYVRYSEDLAIFAKLIRHERDPVYSYEHDLIVHETLLKISGLPTE